MHKSLGQFSCLSPTPLSPILSRKFPVPSKIFKQWFRGSVTMNVFWLKTHAEGRSRDRGPSPSAPNLNNGSYSCKNLYSVVVEIAYYNTSLTIHTNTHWILELTHFFSSPAKRFHFLSSVYIKLLNGTL